VVSGSIDERTAGDMMQAGAGDYLMKDHLARLGPVVERELRAAADRADRKRETQQLAEVGARYEASAIHRSTHDGLTDLPNRTLLRARLEEALREPTSSVALILLDLDRFKEVNDTLGHHVGDVLPQQIGQRLQRALHGTGLVARLGGDEFAVLLPSTEVTGAAQVAKEIVGVLQTSFILEYQPIAVEASLGIALAPEHAQDADTLLRCADVAMYQAKRSGMGVALYSATDDQHSPGRLALLAELRTAIDRDELLLHYQPKLDLRDGTLVGVEALVRWQHPQRGFLPPSEFIPLAERTGLIYPFSNWVLETAIKQLQAWKHKSIDIPVAVNLSRRTLHDVQLPEMVARLLTRWGVRPSALVLEITESSLMSDPLGAAENLSRLRALGVRISIDDFGTGYSSLASLKNLSVDELKIDQSFVTAMATDASSRAIVRAIIDLADALNLHVVAEGVEDRATWDVLAGLGCEVAQGYFLSRPIGAAGLEAWIAEDGPSWLAMAARSEVDDALQQRTRGRGVRLTAEEEFIATKHAEASLRASEERNRLALHAAGMGTWDWDVVRNIHTWSAESEMLLGLAPGTLKGDLAAFRLAIHPDDWSDLDREWRRAFAERGDFSVSYRTIWPDGSVRWIEDKGRGVYAGAEGNPVRMSGTSIDITVRKQAEERLLANEERFRKQYKRFPLPTYSWLREGEDFVLQDYNDAAEAVVGIGISEWLGARASAYYAETPRVVDDLQAYIADQRTIRRVLHREVAERETDVALTYVFVPPSTVMIHTDDPRQPVSSDRSGVSRPESGEDCRCSARRSASG
jgi:diguanylate cyclase (GGDEF)-like protein/PAS domain S-box-containing protein